MNFRFGHVFQDEAAEIVVFHAAWNINLCFLEKRKQQLCAEIAAEDVDAAIEDKESRLKGQDMKLVSGKIADGILTDAEVQLIGGTLLMAVEHHDRQHRLSWPEQQTVGDVQGHFVRQCEDNGDIHVEGQSDSLFQPSVGHLFDIAMEQFVLGRPEGGFVSVNRLVGISGKKVFRSQFITLIGQLSQVSGVVLIQPFASDAALHIHVSAVGGHPQNRRHDDAPVFVGTQNDDEMVVVDSHQ